MNDYKSPLNGEDIILVNGYFVGKDTGICYQVNEGIVSAYANAETGNYWGYDGAHFIDVALAEKKESENAFIEEDNGYFTNLADKEEIYYAQLKTGEFKPLVSPITNQYLKPSDDVLVDPTNNDQYTLIPDKEVIIPLFIPDQTHEEAFYFEGHLVGKTSGTAYEIKDDGTIVTPLEEVKEQLLKEAIPEEEPVMANDEVEFAEQVKPKDDYDGYLIDTHVVISDHNPELCNVSQIQVDNRGNKTILATETRTFNDDTITEVITGYCDSNPVLDTKIIPDTFTGKQTLIVASETNQTLTFENMDAAIIGAVEKDVAGYRKDAIMPREESQVTQVLNPHLLVKRAPNEKHGGALDIFMIATLAFVTLSASILAIMLFVK